MKAEVLYTHSKVYTDRSRVHKGAQVLVSQPVGLSFGQLVVLSVGWSARRSGTTCNSQILKFTYYSQVPKLLLTNFSQSSTVVGAKPAPSRDVEQFGCLLKKLMTFCSWPPDSGEVRRTLQSESLDFKMVSI